MEQIEKREQSELATKPVGSLIFQLAIPTIAAQIINLLYNIVDRIYIGKIEGVGILALTGVGVTTPVLMLIAAFAALFGSGGAPRASIYMGKKDIKSAEKTLGNCFVMIIIISMILTAIFSIYASKILLAFGAETDTLPYALEYIQIYVIGTIFVQIVLGLNPFITAQGFSKVSMLTILIGAIANIILDPLFIFGFGLGVKGAAIATIISQSLSAVWIIKFLLGDKTMLKIKKENLKLDPKIILPAVALGLAPFIMTSTESILSVVFNVSLRTYGGTIAVGTMTILATIMQFSMLPIQGFTQGIQPVIGYNYGAGNLERVKKAFKIGVITCLSFTVVMWTINMVFPRFFGSLFTPDKELLDYIAWAIRIYMAASCIFGIQMACQQTFVALGKVASSLFLALLRKVILLIPLILILPNFFENKVFAVFLAEPIADFISVTVTVILFTYQFKKVTKELSGNKNK